MPKKVVREAGIICFHLPDITELPVGGPRFAFQSCLAPNLPLTQPSRKRNAQSSLRTQNHGFVNWLMVTFLEMGIYNENQFSTMPSFLLYPLKKGFSSAFADTIKQAKKTQKLFLMHHILSCKKITTTGQ